MKVKSWISHEDAQKYKDYPIEYESDFDATMRWNDYIDRYYHKVRPYLEAIRMSVIVENKYFTGDEHQMRSDGVPLFEDDTVAVLGWRGWGALMAAICSERENVDYSDMDFYMRFRSIYKHYSDQGSSVKRLIARCRVKLSNWKFEHHEKIGGQRVYRPFPKPESVPANIVDDTKLSKISEDDLTQSMLEAVRGVPGDE